MIAKSDYEEYKERAQEFLNEFAGKLQLENPKIDEALGPVMDYLREEDNIRLEDGALQYSIGDYVFWMEVKIPLTDVGYDAVIRTYEIITHRARLANGEQERWYHIEPLDLRLTNDHWDIVNKTPSTVDMYDYVPRVVRYIEEVEGEEY